MSISVDIWSLIAFGIGFWMLMDGLMVGVMPSLMRKLMLQMRDVSTDDLRMAGLVCAITGAGLVYLVIGL